MNKVLYPIQADDRIAWLQSCKSTRSPDYRAFILHFPWNRGIHRGIPRCQWNPLGPSNLPFLTSWKNPKRNILRRGQSNNILELAGTYWGFQTFGMLRLTNKIWNQILWFRPCPPWILLYLGINVVTTNPSSADKTKTKVIVRLHLLVYEMKSVVTSFFFSLTQKASPPFPEISMNHTLFCCNLIFFFFFLSVFSFSRFFSSLFVFNSLPFYFV